MSHHDIENEKETNLKMQEKVVGSSDDLNVDSVRDNSKEYAKSDELTLDIITNHYE